MGERRLGVHDHMNGPWPWRALTLAERARLLQSGTAPIGREPLVRPRERWKKLDEESVDYLIGLGVSHGIPESSVGAVLREPAGYTTKHDRAGSVSRARSRLREEANWRQAVSASTVDEIWPEIEVAIAALPDRLLPAGPDRGVFEQDLFHGLVDRVSSVALKTFCLELNVARLEDRLIGEDAEERYLKYLALLQRPEEWRTWASRYPVLDRVTHTVARGFAEGVAEVMSRVDRDLPELVASGLLPRDHGPLSRVQCGMGDSHAGGRSVIRLIFSDGTSLVYKPRDVSLEVLWGRVVAFSNRRSGVSDLRAAAALNRDGYGWQAYVQHRPLGADDTIDLFYERLGRTVALAYCTGAADLHRENVVADGAYPVLVDLEMLLQPIVFPPRGALGFQNGVPRRTAILTNLLPQPRFNSRGEVSDSSGIGSPLEQLTAEPVPVLQRKNTDEMRLGRERTPIPPVRNQPAGPGADQGFQAHRSQILEGAIDHWEWIFERRGELKGILREAARGGARARVVFRRTQLYGDILAQSYHPDVLHDAIDREVLLGSLRHYEPAGTHTEAIVTAEVDALRVGDVPYFHARLDGTTVRTPSGDPVAEAETAAIGVAERRIDALDKGIARQAWAVCASLYSGRVDPAAAQYQSSVRFAYPTTDVEPDSWRDQAVDLAHAVAQHVASLAFEDDTHVGWLTQTAIGSSQLATRSCDASLYDGLSGIGLALVFIGEHVGDAEMLAIGKKALSTASELVGDPSVEADAIDGVFGNRGGVIYALAHVGTLLGDRDLIGKGAELARAAGPPGAGSDAVASPWDVVSGSAGAILALLAMDACLPGDEFATLAEGHGDWLKVHAQVRGDWATWRAPAGESAPLTGLSHGAAGIGMALMRLGERVGRDDFVDLGVRALRYDSEVRGAHGEEWPDFRTDIDSTEADLRISESSLGAWCHGPPGSGLALSAVRGATPEASRGAFETYMAEARDRTMRQAPLSGLCLCHGSLGVAEALRETAPDEASVERTDRAALVHVERRLSLKTALGHLPLFPDPPGLMTGLSGIAYGLLQVGTSGKGPSVLTLQSPEAHEV